MQFVQLLEISIICKIHFILQPLKPQWLWNWHLGSSPLTYSCQAVQVCRLADSTDERCMQLYIEW
jgi:hypothetical protein